MQSSSDSCERDEASALQTETLTDGDSLPRHRTGWQALSAGARRGRYVVLDRIAQGAMGVVYAAYDPKLDRRIAVKVLHPALADGGESSGGVARLIREARALAKLSHPNVVAVFDADVIDEQVFIAMEFVDGVTWPHGCGRASDRGRKSSARS